MSFQPPKGTDDILPPDSQVWRVVLLEWEEWSARFGYPLVATPLFEATDLFLRGVGDTTEVVTKQMYTFEDKGGRSLTLRPEGTAGVVRAFLDSGARGAWKGAYSGPMFRYERPQGGRRRQFWQVGVEFLDVESPIADVEVIELGFRYIESVGVNGLELRINTLGDHQCRPAYLTKLRAFFAERREELCEDSQSLIEVNPLRILDCKVCAPVMDDVPGMKDALCEACAAHYDTVRSSLTDLGIPFTEDPKLVRGLDYYTRTAFEYIGTGLDTAQNAIGGGGRYDGLAESIGGRQAPGVGFALGIDRIIMAMNRSVGPALDVYIVSETGPGEALRSASLLRSKGLRVDFDASGRSTKAQFKSASSSGAPATVIIHASAGEVSVRTMDDRRDMPLEEVAEWLKSQR
ncbi:MAG: histidine--tRNA ligase [Acidimicrobiia bacterium]|nr:histidine--tRNA ligase [Acidimicrobiia bacterium]MDH3462791.1 histidine--tRNA ligase [Acidimicrobiia bacterium]